jgi:hypothetical protein
VSTSSTPIDRFRRKAQGTTFASLGFEFKRFVRGRFGVGSRSSGSNDITSTRRAILA